MTMNTQNAVTEEQTLCFLIDTTGSMGSWISALRTVLHEVIDSAVLTGAFTRIGVMSYTDYDQTKVVTRSDFVPINNEEKVRELHQFAKELRAVGGGGTPEAFKTAMWELLEAAPADGVLHVVLLTDAYMHLEGKLDGEGKKEKEFLQDRFPLHTVLNAWKQRGNMYFSAVVDDAKYFVRIAEVFNGEVTIPKSSYSATELRKTLQKLISGWMGVTNDLPLWAPATSFQFTGKETDGELTLDSTKREAPTKKRPALALPLESSLKRLKKDEQYVDELCVTLRRVCSESPMALCANPVLGKLWRGFLQRRSDPRREEFLELLEASKEKLSKSDKEVFTEWSNESFNSEADICAEVWDHIAKHGVQGLVRYHGDEEGFIPRSLNTAFVSFTMDDQENITSILSRLTIDEKYTLPPTPKDESGERDEDAPLPLPDNSLPLNLPPGRLMALLCHTAVKGTRLTRRPTVLLCLLALLHGGVIKPYAATFLEEVRGQWLDFSLTEKDKKKTDDDDYDDSDDSEPKVKAKGDEKKKLVPKFSENFNVSLLRLVMRFHKECLTEEETVKVRLLLLVSGVIRVETQEYTGIFTELTSADGVHPDHVAECKLCGVVRSLSLLAEDGVCGYCHRRRTDQGREKYEPETDRAGGVGYRRHQHKDTLGPDGHHVAPPATDPAAQYQVRCAVCGGFYARSLRKVYGENKCHACQFGKPPQNVTCENCKLPMVCPAGKLPDGVCAPCAAGEEPRKLKSTEKPIPLRILFPLNVVFTKLYRAVGLRLVEGAIGPIRESNLAIAAQSFELADDADKVDEPVPTITYNPPDQFSLMTNRRALWRRLIKSVTGYRGAQKPTCAICCQIFNSEALTSACGRKACSQRLCQECAQKWYGKNVPGQTIVTRALQCPCCARDVASSVLRKYNRDAVVAKLVSSLAQAREATANTHVYFGWCCGCLQPAVCGEATCEGFDPVEVKGFRCEKCMAMVSEGKPLRKCPGCNTETIRVSGCAHMTCVCGQHWCYLCGQGFDTAEETYKHMSEAHEGSDYVEDSEVDEDEDE